MEDFVSKAVEKIEGGVSSVKDRYGKVVARPVADALISFCAGAEPEVADRLGGALAKVVAMMAERV